MIARAVAAHPYQAAPPEGLREMGDTPIPPPRMGCAPATPAWYALYVYVAWDGWQHAFRSIPLCIRNAGNRPTMRRASRRFTSAVGSPRQALG
jgi:hypothetical protein